MNLVDFVKAREGYKRDNGDGTVSAYWDANGSVWTIAWGLTGPGITQGTTWTETQAETELAARVERARSELLAISPNIQWPPGAQDALTDFVYNEGQANYARSHVRTAAEAGDWGAVRVNLLQWEYAGGKRLGGLVTRREDEAAMIQA